MKYLFIILFLFANIYSEAQGYFLQGNFPFIFWDTSNYRIKRIKTQSVSLIEDYNKGQLENIFVYEDLYAFDSLGRKKFLIDNTYKNGNKLFISIDTVFFSPFIQSGYECKTAKNTSQEAIKIICKDGKLVTAGYFEYGRYTYYEYDLLGRIIHKYSRLPKVETISIYEKIDFAYDSLNRLTEINYNNLDTAKFYNENKKPFFIGIPFKQSKRYSLKYEKQSQKIKFIEEYENKNIVSKAYYYYKSDLLVLIKKIKIKARNKNVENTYIIKYSFWDNKSL